MTRDEIDACMEEYREVTAATAEDLERASARLDAFEHPSGYDPADLGDAPGPARGAAARVEARLREASQPPPAPWGWSAGMAAVMVTVALLLLSIGGPPVLDEDPWADAPVAAEVVPEPAAFDATLGAEAEVRPSEHVLLRVDGEGELRGDAEAPRIAWARGALVVEVTADRGVDLQVRTAEGTVAVVGTAFVVDRDARRGTRVTVRHGVVRVACLGVDTVALTDGQDVLCPARAALLGAARKAARAADHRAAITAATRGLAMGADDAVGGELLFVRLESLIASEDTDAARVDAEAYLESGGPRVEAVEAILREL